MTPASLIERGLARSLEPFLADVAALREARLLISGGTGFVGKWLLNSIAYANRLGNSNITAVVITRSARSFEEAAPELAGNMAFRFLESDVRAIPSSIGAFDAVIHAATPASAELNLNAPLEMLDTIIDGGRTMLELASRSGRIPFLFLSSGAIYGDQDPKMFAQSETLNTAPDPLSAHAAYHEGKRVGELQCAAYSRAGRINAKIARLFAFVGPYLPIDRHFAAGNFIGDALRGSAIRVNGDGRAVRTYLSAADMTRWLWAVLARGEDNRAYNIGAAKPVTIAELANVVASLVPGTSVIVRDPPDLSRPAHRYVPDVSRITTELGVGETIDLAGALEEMLDFYRGRGQA
jgi:dTDP-glucose 4,6-dehydratase